MTEREIFLGAVERDDPTERVAYLDRSCGTDAKLRRRVEALLRSLEIAPDFMEVPVGEQLAVDTEGVDFLAPSERPDSLGRLGHYEVLEVVGRGGMGVVFRAFDTKLHRVVALKALAPQLATSSTARERFVREARAAAAVTHEHVVAVHAVEDVGSVPYLVMQFIDGPTLQKKLDRIGQMSAKEILRITLQIAEGLAAAHRHGLVHRDIKPANILLENDSERVKITDFGLARAGDDVSLTGSGVVVGTPMYMSPEQADGLPVDFRSDLFSLGTVLYTMCAGRPPFLASSPRAVLKRVCEETPRPIREINPELPPGVGALVARLQAKNPADRFSTAQEVADLLTRYLAELQPDSLPSKFPARPGRPRRRWWMAVAVLPVLLAGLALAVVHLFAPADTPTTAQVAIVDEATWERSVADLPAKEKVKAVTARLKELNPGFDGKVTATTTGDVVTGLQFSTDQVTNIAPVRVLTGLKFLDVSGTQGQLADLSPLKGLSLSVLRCDYTKVSDLSPLREMPLTSLACGATDVSDLTPLKDMPLRALFCQCPKVSDLSPLQGMRLDRLDVSGSAVSNLSSLRGMPLKELNLYGATLVTNLSPLQGSDLESLNLGRTAVSDLEPLENMMSLRELILAYAPVADLSKLKRLPLKSLHIQYTMVTNLAPLKDMSVKHLWLDYQPRRDAEVLRDLKSLERINGMTTEEFWKSREK